MQEEERGRVFRAGFAIKDSDSVNVDRAISDDRTGDMPNRANRIRIRAARIWPLPALPLTALSN
jgi:hypothetical protein